MSDNNRVFGRWIVITPAEHDAIIKASDAAGMDWPGSGDGGKKLGEALAPLMDSNLGLPITWSILVVQPNGEPHEIPGTDKVAITPTWDPGVIYVLPKAIDDYLAYKGPPPHQNPFGDQRYPLLPPGPNNLKIIIGGMSS